jgi:hypothetical protein
MAQAFRAGVVKEYGMPLGSAATKDSPCRRADPANGGATEGAWPQCLGETIWIAPMPAPRHIAPAMPLLRLLAINCAAGIAIAMLALGGLLVLHDQLRNLIFSDHSPVVALALLGGGFVVTFASVVMGSAIMRLGGE